MALGRREGDRPEAQRLALDVKASCIPLQICVCRDA